MCSIKKGFWAIAGSPRPCYGCFGLVENCLINYQGGIPPAVWGVGVGDCGDSPDNCSNSQWGSGDGLATGGARGYTEARVA